MTCKGLKQDVQVIRSVTSQSCHPVDKAHATKIVLHGRIGVPAFAIIRHHPPSMAFIRKLNEVEPVEALETQVENPCTTNLLKGYKRQDKIVTYCDTRRRWSAHWLPKMFLANYPTFPRPLPDHRIIPQEHMRCLAKMYCKAFFTCSVLLLLKRPCPRGTGSQVPGNPSMAWHDAPWGRVRCCHVQSLGV